MDLNGRIWIVVAGISGLLAVALGAYGAHGLDGDAVVMGQFDTANRYHMWHTLAMLGAALGRDRLGPRAAPWATGAAALFAIRKIARISSSRNRQPMCSTPSRPMMMSARQR